MREANAMDIVSVSIDKRLLMATLEGHVVYQNLMRILFDSLKPKAPLHIKKFNVVFFSAIIFLNGTPSFCNYFI